MTDDLMKRLARAASDEFGTPAESRELARDALAKIEWLDNAVAMMAQDNTQDSEDLARLHALVTCEPQASDLHDHTACVAEEMDRLRASVPVQTTDALRVLVAARNEARAEADAQCARANEAWAEVARPRGNTLYAEHLALVDRKFTGEFSAADEARLAEVRADIDRMEALQRIDTLVAENERMRLIAAQHDGLVEERDHYRDRARTLGMRFDWAQHVAATAMREGLAACESLRDAACLADDLRELAEKQCDDAMDRLRRAKREAEGDRLRARQAECECERLRSEAVVVDLFNEEQAIAIAQTTIRAGRRRAPSHDEIEAHAATGGRWRARLSHGGIYSARRPDAAILEHVGATWWAIDGDDNECTWPVLQQANQGDGVKA